MTDEWQPIESAPKDGQRILLIDTDHDIQVALFGRYYDDEAEMIVSGWTPNELIYYVDPDFTHWMPLPEPPKKANT